MIQNCAQAYRGVKKGECEKDSDDDYEEDLSEREKRMEKLKQSLNRRVTLYDPEKMKNIYPTKEDRKREALKRKAPSGQNNNVASESKTKNMPSATKTTNSSNVNPNVSSPKNAGESLGKASGSKLKFVDKSSGLKKKSDKPKLNYVIPKNTKIKEKNLKFLEGLD